VQVAVARVRVVEGAVHVVVHVVAVRNRFVSGSGVGAGARALDGRADAGPPPVDVEAMFVGVAFVRSVQVSVVEVVGVAAMRHGFVAAAFAVSVGMLPVLFTAHEGIVSRPGAAVNRGIIV
jgi:hypothetical protein